MNGIDTGASALNLSRAEALSPVGQGNAGAAQAGVSALANGAPQALDVATQVAVQQESAQTELSALALTLDAIQRSGGAATPAVVGAMPLWTNAQANAADANVPLPAQLEALDERVLDNALAAAADAAAQGAAAAPAPGAADAAATQQAQTQTASSSTQTSATPTNVSAAQAANGTAAANAAAAPVLALAQALEQAVSDSGLFYESHLAQWLVGQRTLAQLAGEPQNRLPGAATLAAFGAQDADDVEDVLWSTSPSSGAADPRGGAPSAANARDPGPALAQNAAASVAQHGAAGQMLAAFDGVSPESPAMLEARSLGLDGQPAHDAQTPAGANVLPASVAAVHPALVPLVRQQLDLLATGEFRWTGEAWPGVRFDWTIREEPDDARRGGGGVAAAPSWRTRVTLALPALGTIDADLTLSGDTLVVRIQANAHGAQRLNADSTALRERLEAAGIMLNALSIRQTDGGPDIDAAHAMEAAQAYAQAASAASQGAAAPPPAAASDDFDALGL